MHNALKAIEYEKIENNKSPLRFDYEIDYIKMLINYNEIFDLFIKKSIWIDYLGRV